MNLYIKLNNARYELQNLRLKKSGLNKYSSYNYYELGDFLPAINSLCLKYDMTTRFNIIADKNSEKAILTIINSSEPQEKLEFISPTAEVEIGKKKDGTGGAEPIQNLGGKITYMRRYMLMTAFEMVESDRVEQINRELTGSISDDDLEKINKTRTQSQLIKVCSALKTKYKTNLITPHYERRIEELKQDEVELQKKGKK